MANLFTDKYHYRDDKLITDNLEPVLEKAKMSVYEVIRIIGGLPLFLEDHIERLKKSLNSFSLDKSGLESSYFRGKILSLCAENGKYYGNIEILVTSEDEKKITIFVGFISHKYPEEKDYQLGVRVEVIRAERENPNIKVKNTNARLAAEAFLAKNSCFEVLFKNRDNLITEGSRSNFFYFKEDKLFSAPVPTVLAGITRKYVLIAAEKAGIEIHEGFLLVDQVKDIDAAFLSGTSLGVLPISHIGKHQLNLNHEQLRKLMKAFRRLVLLT